MTQRKSQEMRQISSQAPQFPLMKRSREEAVAMLRQKTSLWGQFQELPEALREELLSFAMGNSGLKVCYDPIFKMVFDPEIHKERLSGMLSCIMGQSVTVKRALPSESSRITADGSLLIMDILTEPENGERAACYSSDLMLRQYSRGKSRS